MNSSIKAAIPNGLTLTNLGAGVVALCSLDLKIALICVCIGLVADVFDGAAARALGVDGDLGALLDSLADLVTFCVVPGVVSYHTIFAEFQSPLVIGILVAYILMGGYRLARFIVSTEEKTDFQGMPTPASAIGVMGVWIASINTPITEQHLALYLSLFIILGLLNISKVRMLSLKGISNSRLKLMSFGLIIALGLLSIWLRPQYAILITLIGYISLSIIYGIIYRKNF